MFKVEAMDHGYINEYHNAFDGPIGEILSCKREVGNIHVTFVLAITKDGERDGEGSHRCWLSLFQQLSFLF